MTCSRCGTEGHTKAKCVRCLNCGTWGHDASTCKHRSIRCARCGYSRRPHNRYGCKRFMYPCSYCEEELCADLTQANALFPPYRLHTAGEEYGLNPECWKCRLFKMRLHSKYEEWERETLMERVSEWLERERGQEYLHELERKEQLQWLAAGRKTLKQIRQYLKTHQRPEASPSPPQA